MIFILEKINPVENIAVAIVAMGEGWHNYHVRFKIFFMVFNLTSNTLKACLPLGLQGSRIGGLQIKRHNILD